MNALKKLLWWSAAGVTMFSLLTTPTAQARETRKVVGIRLDAGYLYDVAYQQSAGGGDVAKLSRMVVQDVASQGFNTIFFLAYTPDSGAMYPTNYPMTTVEGDFGINNFMQHLIDDAHQKNIAVVAWLPVNNFKLVWQQQPNWREKTKRQRDYRPSSDSYLLSSWNGGFRNWYQGFLEDICKRYPGLDGLEAGEGVVDYNWDGAADYNREANTRFMASFPGGRLGDANWYQFRAKGLTDLHRLVGLVAHKYNKDAYTVQTWSAVDDSVGSLMSSAEIAQGSGFDFDGVLNLAANDGKPDYIVGEFMWQQWKDSYGNYAFNVKWTHQAGRDFIARVANRATPVVHIELSPFGSVSLNQKSFLQTLNQALFSGTTGVDIYDYHQMKQMGLLNPKRPLFGPKSILAYPFPF